MNVQAGILYPVTEQLAELLARLEEGEFSPEEAADTVEALTGDWSSAVGELASAVKETRALAEAIDGEIDALMARRADAEARAERLLHTISAAMARLGEKRVETARCCVLRRRTPPRVVIADERDFIAAAQAAGRDELLKTALSVKPNREEIKRRISAGETIAGAALEQGECIVIK